MSDYTLNDPKDKFATAYLLMLAAQNRLLFTDHTGGNKDKIGVDVEIYDHECVEVKFQVKATAISSTSMVKFNDDGDLLYNFDQSKYRVNKTCYLCVVVLPSESMFDTWLETEYKIHGEASSGLLLRAQAFYLPIDGNYTNEDSKTKIPKSNILNCKSLKEIVDKVKSADTFLQA